MNKVLLLNFSSLNISSLKKDIEVEVKNEVTAMDIRVSMNLRGNCYQQIVSLLEPYRKTIMEHAFVIIVPPALSLAAVYLVTELEAISKKPPLIVEVEKDENASSVLGTVFHVKRVRNLSLEKQISRKRIEASP